MSTGVTQASGITAVPGSGGGSPGGTTYSLQYNNGAAFAGLGLGTAGQVLTSQGTGGVPIWAASSGGSGVTFGSSISASPAAGPLNSYSPTGYTAGTTNRLLLTPAAGGSTLNGLVAPATDGWTVLVWNASSANALILAHASDTTPANEFYCPSGLSYNLVPYGTLLLTYVTSLSAWVVK